MIEYDEYGEEITEEYIKNSLLLMSEKEAVNRFVSLFKEYCERTKINYMINKIESRVTTKGHPDIELCTYKNIVKLEFKIDDNKLNSNQIIWWRKASELNLKGGIIYYIKGIYYFFLPKSYEEFTKINKIRKMIRPENYNYYSKLDIIEELQYPRRKVHRNMIKYNEFFESIIT